MARLVSGSPPLISVMIPSYNYLHYITTAIDSVRAQTYPNVEILVSDNRSTDGTVAALRERYAGDDRVRIDVNDENLGMIGNFNAAFARSQGAFVLWLSADDWILPRHLERLAAVFAREPAIDVVYSGALYADAEGRIYGMRGMPGQFVVDYVDARDELVEMLTTTCPLCWPTALFRRELFEELGLFDVDGPLASDWEVQVRFAINGKRFAYLAEPSTVVRTHETNVTGNAYHDSGHNIRDFLAIVERYIDHPGMERMRGRELRVARFIDELIGSNQTAAAAMAETDRARVRALKDTLTRRGEHYEPARARDWRASVVILVQGPVQYVLRALDSVHAQTYANLEIVIVDQGPIPLEHVLRAHPAWDRISYLRLPVGLSTGTGRNIGLRMARGELLAFVDADATLHPEHIRSLVETIPRGGFEIAAASSRLVLEVVTLSQSRVLGAAESVFRGPDDSPVLGQIANALPLGALLFYRRLRDTAGPFNEQAPVLEDFEMVLRMERTAAFGFSGSTTFEAHVGLGMPGNALAAQLVNYVPMLDLIYGAYPAEGLIQQRAQHRAAVAAAIARGDREWKDPQGLANFFGVLAGRSVVPQPG